jgi:hypothetical protein
MSFVFSIILAIPLYLIVGDYIKIKSIIKQKKLQIEKNKQEMHLIKETDNKYL